ncbi:MAG: hypothetical protein GXO75_05685 [Calditrichaeota bacterium]|nr:hypothetical protein [Calditrichota bacterium]
MGNWKGVRLRPSKPLQLYDLSKDMHEENDVAQNYPDVVRKIETIMIEGRTESQLFPLVKG